MRERFKKFWREYLGIVFEIYRPFRKIMLVMLAFMAIIQMVNLVQPYIYGRMIDAIVAKKAITLFAVLTGVWVSTKVLNIVLSYFKGMYELRNFDWDVNRRMNDVSLEKVFGFSIGQHRNQHSGVNQETIKTGQHSLESIAFMVCYEFLPLVLQTIFAIGALMYFSVLIGLVAFAGAAGYTLICIKLNKMSAPDLKIIDDYHKESAKKHSEILRNISLIMTNVKQKTVVSNFLGHWDALAEKARAVWTRYEFWAHVRWLVITGTEVAVISLGVLLVYGGKFTPGGLITCMFWTNNVFGRLGSLGSMQRQFMKASASVKQYIDLMKMKSDIEMSENPQRPKIAGRVVFDNVSFKYPVRLKEGETNEEVKSGEALSGINFTIEPGQKVALVGHSGAGKSTIINLLLRAYDPNDGSISVDGVDLKELDLSYYHRNIGMVEQHVELFDNTLRYNIAFGMNSDQTNASDDQLEWVAKASCITKFFHRLEHGFDTIIGEKGVKLSGGERQRVGIARALIKKPKILIFDEATSNLDAENEVLIHKAIREASKGRTTIVIAHRLSTIMDADKIFVFHEGQIVSAGTHAELLQDCGKYQNLINSQVANI